MSRPFRPFPSLIFVFVFAAGLVDASRAASLRLIAAANVTLRQKPSPQAEAVTRLPLGTEVAEAGDADLDRTWVHVVTADGKDGWVLANLTRPLDAYWKWQTQEQVIVERLARKGDGFPADVELVDFIERIADSFTDADARARMDLYRLQALQETLAAVPPGRSEREPYASWLARYKDWTVYDKAAGAWILDAGAIWKVHDQRADRVAADDIAWFAASAGAGGECAGYLPCYFDSRNHRQGEYLRRHPAGAHAAEAVSEIGRTAILLGAPAGPRSAYRFDPREDCGPLSAPLGALERAVENAMGAPERDATLMSLAALGKPCR